MVGVNIKGVAFCKALRKRERQPQHLLSQLDSFQGSSFGSRMTIKLLVSILTEACFTSEIQLTFLFHKTSHNSSIRFNNLTTQDYKTAIPG